MEGGFGVGNIVFFVFAAHVFEAGKIVIVGFFRFQGLLAVQRRMLWFMW